MGWKPSLCHPERVHGLPSAICSTCGLSFVPGSTRRSRQLCHVRYTLYNLLSALGRDEDSQRPKLHSVLPTSGKRRTLGSNIHCSGCSRGHWRSLCLPITQKKDERRIHRNIRDGTSRPFAIAAES